jgi:hypothetical protein
MPEFNFDHRYFTDAVVLIEKLVMEGLAQGEDLEVRHNSIGGKQQDDSLVQIGTRAFHINIRETGINIRYYDVSEPRNQRSLDWLAGSVEPKARTARGMVNLLLK